MSFWDWALQAYARPQVEGLCLELQDTHGQSVAYLLWAAWLDAEGRRVAPTELIHAMDMARAWEAEIIGPLRSVRRRLKKDRGPALRDQVKAAELAAERELMEILEARATASHPHPAPWGGLATAAAAWSPHAPAALLEQLSSALR